MVGKNTVTKKAISIRMQEPKPSDECYDFRKKFWSPLPQLAKLTPYIKGRVAMIFTNEPVSVVKPKVESIVMQTKAKVGDIAQCEVTIPKGPTGIAPADIKFFQALKITTKIFKS